MGLPRGQGSERASATMQTVEGERFRRQSAHSTPFSENSRLLRNELFIRLRTTRTRETAVAVADPTTQPRDATALQPGILI